ncbi:OLC1v1017179C1 [Oldenlandia corymbosa var. corymbosa]|uniref:rhamnogalacturonan endolyase n=1 Tax=Oldenlandia corymbosa var. corymbosa TaxID=529605 RepID=A0AAV1E901_OLDCO|nr:OLC1v1017179C1 [Oldenlandia corymbosa var. corymbosa]
METSGVQLTVADDHVVIDNGIVEVTLSNPGGVLKQIKYGGIDNLLELNYKDLKGGIEGTALRVIVQKDEQVELSFPRVWSPSVKGTQAPLSIDRWSFTLFYQHFRNSPCNEKIFHTSHYAGEDLLMKFEDGEVWKKVLGPVCIYLNSASKGAEAAAFWDDTKEQMNKEVQSWPYAFPASEDFPKTDERGSVSGKLLVQDRSAPSVLLFSTFTFDNQVPQQGSHTSTCRYVGVAAPGIEGSWQRESKEYQFWTTVASDGSFIINNIRPGNYNLYAWVPGYIGDYKYATEINITAGSEIQVGETVYEPPRDGPTLWEIGIPDRSAAEFYIPDPNPKYINRLYVNHPDRFRQYGLWESDYKKDWFFAQVTRKSGENEYKSTTWQIKFNIDAVEQTGTYKLRIALASAHNSDIQVVISNGILQLTFTNPGGIITQIQYGGIDNLLELNNPSLNGGFWDLNWSKAGSSGTRGDFDTIEGTTFRVIVENDEQVEISFTRTWDPSQQGDHSPLNIDKRFILLRGCSGFYSYAIYEHSADMPAFNLNETRIAFMLKIDKFHYMALSDDRQRYLPLPDDRLAPRGKELAYPEAVLLVDPVEPEFKGEVDDKYLYSCENKDNKVHGFISMEPSVGFWQITPSNEFRTGGPIKQDLTSHVNPTTLAMFVSTHYGGEDLVIKFGKGEPWKKVFGPVFIYLNCVSDQADALTLWDDAKRQMNQEVQSWPYSFPDSADFPKADQRGCLSGRLLVKESLAYLETNLPFLSDAHIGLAPPGNIGSFQKECKGYQFWTKTDNQGCFSINNIRPGDYNIYAWVPGFIGDYQSESIITITAGCRIDLEEDVIFIPPRDGPTLWEIGIPDRSAAEFYIPDPNPEYINKLYINLPEHKFRQYGLWERYAELYPDGDLVYTVGTSDYHKDWFYAHVNRKIGTNSFQSATWQIKFEVDNVVQSGTYKLRIALASANVSELQVRVNSPKEDPPHFSTGTIGTDNAIARHGIHGLYWLFNVDIQASQLLEGNNTIYLTQAKNDTALHGIMYDYIRLECPAPENGF